jgi:hypothetical protein
MGALVVAGAVSAAAVLAILFAVLRRVRTRDAALWTALAIPALVFMPNAGGRSARDGLPDLARGGLRAGGGALAAGPGEIPRAAGACSAPPPRGRAAGSPGSAVSSGASPRSPPARSRASCVRATGAPGLRDAVAAVLAGAAVLAAGLGALRPGRGASTPVVRDGHVLLTGLPSETRYFLLHFSGVYGLASGLAEMAYSAAMWTGSRWSWPCSRGPPPAPVGRSSPASS